MENNDLNNKADFFIQKDIKFLDVLPVGKEAKKDDKWNGWYAVHYNAKAKRMQNTQDTDSNRVGKINNKCRFFVPAKSNK